MAEARRGRQRTKGQGGVFRDLSRSKCWIVQYYKDERRIRKSSGTSVKAEAEAFLRREMGDAEKGLVSASAAKKLHYSDVRMMLIDDYAAQQHKSLLIRSDGEATIVGLKELDEHFGFKAEFVDGIWTIQNRGVTVANMTTDSAKDFAKKRLKDGVGPAIINRSLACIRRMLRLAHEDGKIQVVPKIRMLKEPSARKGFLRMEKFDELIRMLPTHLRPLVTCLYWTGVRIGEALQIEWSQVNLDARQIRMEEEQTKNSAVRVLPLTAELVMMLRPIKPKTGRVFDATNLRKEWMKACAACGLGTLTEIEDKPYDPRYEGLTLHDLRRSAVQNLRNTGVSESVIMKISGHKTRSIFDRYAIVSTDDIIDAMQRAEVHAAIHGKQKQLEGELVESK